MNKFKAIFMTTLLSEINNKKSRNTIIDIGNGFWQNKKRIYFNISLFFLFMLATIFIYDFNILNSPIPIIICIISLLTSLLANSTAAGGGIIFFPLFTFIFLENLNTIDFKNSYYLDQVYNLASIVIAIHCIQAFGMLAGSISWWRRKTRILIKENIFNGIGVILGIIIGKFYIQPENYFIFKIFGTLNLLIVPIIMYNIFIKKEIPNKSIWPGKYSWIFFIIGLIGGLLSIWTGTGIGSLTSFTIILLLKPEIGIANGSILMAFTSIATVLIHLINGQSIPIEIVIFAIPFVLFGGYAAPFFTVWSGKLLYKFLGKKYLSHPFTNDKENDSFIEYRAGQIIMTLSFVIIALYNAYIFILK